MSKNYDVIFVGGGVMAAATAYNLLKEDTKIKICVIEKDPTYKHAATTLALGGIRQQFSTRVNIRMARQSMDVYENFGEIMETKSGKPNIDLRQKGYLFVVSNDKWEIAKEVANIQREEEVEIELLEPKEVADMLPGLDMDGVAGGTICRRDGLLDPQSVLSGYIRKTKELGAEYITDEVVGIEKENNCARRVICKSGIILEAGAIVNSAGPWAGEIGKMVGVEVPVEPLPHDIYVCKIPMTTKLDEIITCLPSGGWFVREHKDGDTMMAGITKLDFKYEFNFSPDKEFFYDAVWPDLAEQMEAFDTLKMINAWRGLYEYNYHDFNAIIGEHPHLKGFYLINGFTGHGMMQAPAAGKALAEMIMYGHYKTLDVSELSLQRIYDGNLIVEKAII